MDVRPFLLVVATLLASAVHATPCADDEASGCANTAVQNAEDELDTLYQHLIKQQGQHSMLGKRLINTQHSWNTFRNTECEYISSYGEASGRHQDGYDQCVLIMTEQRIRALQHYQQCDDQPEGCTVNVP